MAARSQEVICNPSEQEKARSNVHIGYLQIFFFFFHLNSLNSQLTNWGFHHFKCPCWGAPSSFNCPVYGKVSQFSCPGQFFLSVTRLQFQFKLNVSINHRFVGFHQLLVRLVVSSEFWATFDERLSSMVNSAVFNRGSVKNIRITRKLILLIAEKIFNKYFKRLKAEKKLSLSSKWNTKVANTMNKTVAKLDVRSLSKYL